MKTMNELWVDHLSDLGYNGKTLQDSLYKFLQSEVPNTSMLMSINDLWASYLEYQGFQGGTSKLYEYLYSLGYTQVSLNDRIVASLIDGTMLKSKHRIKLDFEAGDYRENGFVTPLTDVVTFIRLSAATDFVDGSLLNYAAGVPRISSNGLLIEPQATNLLKSSEVIGTGWGVIRTSVGTAVGATPATSSGTYTTLARTVNDSYIQQELLKFPVATEVFTTTHASDFVNGIPSIDIVKSTSPFTFYNSKLLADGIASTSSTIVPELQDFRYRVRLQGGGASGDLAGFNLGANQLEVGGRTSYIPTGSTPATRSPDSLVIPISPTETISGDWDSGISYTISAGEAIFTGHGRIRSIYVS